MADARGCRAVLVALQGISLRNFGDFNGYAVPIEQSDQNTRIGHKDIIHQDQVRSDASGDEGWAIHTYGSLQYKGRVVVPPLADLRKKILMEFHCSCFTIHPGGTKMYHDLRHRYY